MHLWPKLVIALYNNGYVDTSVIDINKIKFEKFFFSNDSQVTSINA